MQKEPSSEVEVELTVWWGNDDVDASIQISQSQWEDIQNGEMFEDESVYFYEGREYHAQWVFDEGRLNIHGWDGMECVVDLPVQEITCNLVRSDGTPI
jgi:hypothetical protein